MEIYEKIIREVSKSYNWSHRIWHGSSIANAAWASVDIRNLRGIFISRIVLCITNQSLYFPIFYFHLDSNRRVINLNCLENKN